MIEVRVTGASRVLGLVGCVAGGSFPPAVAREVPRPQRLAVSPPVPTTRGAQVRSTFRDHRSSWGFPVSAAVVPEGEIPTLGDRPRVAPRNHPPWYARAERSPSPPGDRKPP